jgi:type IV secretory pathway VirB9-like protein
MKKTRHLSLVTLILCGSLCFAADKRAVSTPHSSDPEPVKPVAVVKSAPPEAEPTAKVVQYGEEDVIKVKAKLRNTTLIVLPKNERILDFICGDKDFWIVEGSLNFASIKPAKAGSQTNLNLITASGNIYSFVFVEVSEMADNEPDLKVFVEPKEDSMVAAASAGPKFVPAQALDDYRQQAEIAKAETQQAKKSAQDAIDSGIAKFLANVRFPYRFEAGKKPFFVRAMYHDDKFTYIQARPEETPTLYEVRDGPNLVNFQYKDGVYVVDKILDEGYLVIGKQKLGFTRQE